VVLRCMNPQFIIIIKVAPTLFADVVIMIGRLVELGIEVAMDSEVVLVLEVPFAVGAVGVHVAIVFSELCVVVEILLIMRFRRFVCLVPCGGTKSATDLFA